MKPRAPTPIIRKTIKWGGALLTALLVVAWIGSAWVFLMWESGTHDIWIVLRDATLIFGMTDRAPTSFTGWHAGWSDTPGLFDWRIRWAEFEFTSDRLWFSIPLWIPSGITLAMTGVVWRLDALARRRARLNLCFKCGYDRAGLAAGAPCPECGASAGMT